MPTITAQANQVGWGSSSYYSTSGSPYWALNNDWNNPANGTQSITYNTSTFPNGTTINWNYGSHIASSNVWGYPEVIYGTQGTSFDTPGGTHPANWGEQIGTLGHFNFNFDYSLTGNQNQYDVLAETHIDGHEVGIVLNSPNYLTDWIKSFTQHHFDLGGISGEAVPNAWGSGSLLLIPDSVENGTPMTHGSIDLAPIIQYAVSQGWLSSSEQVKGWELGVEPQQGAGSLTVNQFSVDWGPGSSTGGSTSGSTGGSDGSTTTTTDGSGSTTTTGGSGSTTTTGGSGSTTTTGGSSTGNSSSGSSTGGSSSPTTVPPSSDPPPTTMPPSSSGDPSNTGSGAASGSSTGGSSSSGSHHHHTTHHHTHHHHTTPHHAHLMATLHRAHHASTASGDDSMAHHLLGIHSMHHHDWS